MSGWKKGEATIGAGPTNWLNGATREISLNGAALSLLIWNHPAGAGCLADG